MTVYYRKVRLKHDPPVAVPAPDFRMVVGTATAPSWGSNRDLLGSHIVFECSDHTNVGMAPPANCPTGMMVLKIEFPNCWDGVHTDSASHRSHVAYSSRGACSPVYEIPIPQIVMHIAYKTGTQVGEISFSSGPYYTVHADFWNTWQQVQLIQLIETCLNSHVACDRVE